MSLMEPPKNNDTKSLVLSGISAVGALMSAYCAYAGPGSVGGEPTRMAKNYTDFSVFAFGLYGAGFLLVPAFLIKMNFTVEPDKYHLFLARMVGFIMCAFTYLQLAADDNAYHSGTVFKSWAIVSTGVGLLGPTYAGLYLEPKQTPMEHMPAHLLFLIGGTLGVLATL